MFHAKIKNYLDTYLMILSEKEGNEIASIEPLKRCNFPELENLMLGFSNSFLN